ncbi:hypothetical protein UPYG_G00332280 [Umbra pygmaea]|uniref:Polypeptide N-acetylgalactosaminyltransferase n=1 Tax=Umbra pygmaea TaxID=75934 RepID=A0ABD0VVX9_UMBPY
MTLWRRPYRRMILCFWVLILALSVATLALLELLFWDKNQTPPSSPLHRVQPLFSGPLELEVMLDSRDQDKPEYGFGLTQLSSLREDHLLFVPVTQVRTSSTSPRMESYRMMKSSAKKQSAVRVQAIGDMGRLDGRESDKHKYALKKYGFNEVLSDRISLHRRLPEVRDPECLVERYSESLPSASVVICFHDEAWSTLLRTVHSVLDTAPRKHLREVLLVDDLSQHGHLKSVLSEYVSRLEGVRLVRSMRHLGVAGCRSLGAARALGEVLVFMDSHCECHGGWLEPLLERVAQDRTRVVSPIIDVIDGQTFQYNATQWPHRGVFDWRLDFHWEPLSQHKHLDSSAEPVRCPALAGSILALDRHFFLSVGAYDPGMQLWGAEHTELSIRVWLCGGSMEVVPCSRVAHLGRHHTHYHLPYHQDIQQRNKIRLAETWLESYRNIYYRRDMLAHFIRQSESPNITERVRLKTSLGCRNFHWFLNNIYPELYVPEDPPSSSGELYNVGTGYCADYPIGGSPEGGAMDVAPCRGNGYQHCELNSLGEMRWGPAGRLCFAGLGERVILTPCLANQPPHTKLRWRVIKLSGQVVHLETQRCLEAVKDKGGEERDMGGHQRGGNPNHRGLFLRPCARHPRQQWHFEQLFIHNGA